MGRCPIPRQRGLFVKSPLWNPEKQRLTFIVWFFIICSQGIKRPAYMPPTRLRRRVVLDQHNARLTRQSQPSVASNYQADFGSQGIKRPAYMPPTRLRRRVVLDQHNASSPAKASLRLQAAVRQAFALKVSKDRRTCRLFAFGVASCLISTTRG